MEITYTYQAKRLQKSQKRYFYRAEIHRVVVSEKQNACNGVYVQSHGQEDHYVEDGFQSADETLLVFVMRCICTDHQMYSSFIVW